MSLDAAVTDRELFHLLDGASPGRREAVMAVLVRRHTPMVRWLEEQGLQASGFDTEYDEEAAESAA